MGKLDEIKAFAATRKRPAKTAKDNPEEWLQAWRVACDAVKLPDEMTYWELLAMQESWFQNLPKFPRKGETRNGQNTSTDPNASRQSCRKIC